LLLGSLLCFILFAVLLSGLDSSWSGSIDHSMINVFGDRSVLSHFSLLGSQPVLGGSAVLLIVFLIWKRNIAGVAAVLAGVGLGNVLNKA